MAWLIVLAVIALPVVEIALFVKSSQAIGVLPTIAAAILAGVAGIYLVRQQGLMTAWRARQQLDRGELPLAEAFDGLCLAVAGALLLLPGFFTDLVALALLLPPVRALLKLWLAGRVRSAVVAGRAGAQPHSQGPRVIETEYRVVDPKDDKP